MVYIFLGPAQNYFEMQQVTTCNFSNKFHENLEKLLTSSKKRIKMEKRIVRALPVFTRVLQIQKHLVFKEQCHEILRICFFHQTTSPGPNRQAQERFQIFQIFAELFVFLINSSAMNTPGSQISFP